MMFRSALWRNDKNKVRASFKLEFHATQATQFNGEELVLSVVPSDVGKPIVRLEKAAVADGKCRWENAAYEAVKFGREPKSGRLTERICQFIVSAGSGKGGFVGEASVDLADYAEITKGSSVALPLKNSSSDAILHIFIKRLPEDGEREADENKDSKVITLDRSLRTRFSNGNGDESDQSITSSSAKGRQVNKASPNVELNGICRASSGSDITVTSSESSSEINTPRENGIGNSIVRRDHSNLLSSMSRLSLPSMRTALESLPTFEEENGETRGGSFSSFDRESVTDIRESVMDIRESDRKEGLRKNVGGEIERLRVELAIMARQADFSNLELQTLRKQIVKECKRSQDLSREIVCLKEERDALDAECNNLRAFRDRIEEVRPKNKMELDGGGDLRALLAEVRQELDFEKNMNADYRMQLQKTQESNAELMLVVKDLDEELLLQKNHGVCARCNRFASSENHDRSIKRLSRSETDDDEEQKALEELVKEHRDAEETYLLEQRILDLSSEIEIYRRDRDELEMQMEQLALDYEILKQKCHDMSLKLEQNQLQEQLKLPYDALPLVNFNELQARIESPESELSCQSKECSVSITIVRELEARIKSLEEELEKRGEEFVTDLEIVMCTKVEQERRAIQAEQALAKLRRKSADTAERLLEEFQRFSEQMASTFDANEKLAMRSLVEAGELRAQKGQLEKMLQRANEELQAVRNTYERKLGELSMEIKEKIDRIERMGSNIDDEADTLDNYKKREKETSRKFTEDIRALKSEILALSQEKTRLSEFIELAEKSSKEAELLVRRVDEDKSKLENAIASIKEQLEDSLGELKRVKESKDDCDRTIASLKLEIRTARVELNDSKNSLIQCEIEKEYLQRQVFQLKGDIKRKKEEMKEVEKKLHESNGHAVESNGGKESKMRSNKKALPVSPDDEEILAEDKGACESSRADDACQPSSSSESVASITCSSGESRSSGDTAFRKKEVPSDEAVAVDLISERNEMMEAELKELQVKYSEMSLKFAMVEGERQRLRMSLRNIKSSKKI